MPAIGADDPERAYRRSYQHGAMETFQAVERFLDPTKRAVVREWIDADNTSGGTRPCLPVRRIGG
jgi:hypothetical protein